MLLCVGDGVVGGRAYPELIIPLRLLTTGPFRSTTYFKSNSETPLRLFVKQGGETTTKSTR